jgi:hypothetical protein
LNCTISKNKEYPLKVILAILNSEFASWYAYRSIFNKAIRTMHFYSYFIGKLIVPKNIDNKISNEIIKLVDQILYLQKKYHDPKVAGNEKERLKQQIDNVSYEIDEEVYKLYGITTEEKKIIEESLK